MNFKQNQLVAGIGSALCATFLVASMGVHAATLRVANQGDATSMDPHSLNESLQLDVTGNVYEPLVTRDKDFKIAPSLATRWKQTSPAVWRFELR